MWGSLRLALITACNEHAQLDEDEVLLTKAAKLLYKIIGQNSELTRFDHLQSKFRKLQCKKQRPTTTDFPY